MLSWPKKMLTFCHGPTHAELLFSGISRGSGLHLPPPRWIYKPCSMSPCRKTLLENTQKTPGAVFPWCHIWMAFPDCSAKQTQIYSCTFQKHSPPSLAALIFFFRIRNQLHHKFINNFTFLFLGLCFASLHGTCWEMIFTHQLAEGPTQAVNKELGRGNCGIIPPFPPGWGSQPN